MQFPSIIAVFSQLLAVAFFVLAVMVSSPLLQYNVFKFRMLSCFALWRHSSLGHVCISFAASVPWRYVKGLPHENVALSSWPVLTWLRYQLVVSSVELRDVFSSSASPKSWGTRVDHCYVFTEFTTESVSFWHSFRGQCWSLIQALTATALFRSSLSVP